MSSGKKASEEMSVLSFSVEKILSPTEASETKTEIVPRSKKRSLEDAHEDVDDHAKCSRPGPTSLSTCGCCSPSTATPTCALEEQMEAMPKEVTRKRRSHRLSATAEDENAVPQVKNCSPGYLVKDGITVELVGQDLWKKFHKLGTEMIITKAGRRMFPTLKIRVSGLKVDQAYIVCLELAPYDDKRYRYVYHSSQWMVAGAGDPHVSPSTFVHGDSPTTGTMWENAGVIAFDKLKLTNNRVASGSGQICLHSMHKYVPKIRVQPIGACQEDLSPLGSLDSLLDPTRGTTFVFPETVFTTVTAYQNQQITKLKIASNPFAKGFREATRTRDTHPSELVSGYLNLGKTFENFAARMSAPHPPPHLPPPLFLYPYLDTRPPFLAPFSALSPRSLPDDRNNLLPIMMPPLLPTPTLTYEPMSAVPPTQRFCAPPNLDQIPEQERKKEFND